MASGITTKTYTGAGAYWVWAEWSSTTNVANNTSTITVISYIGTNSYGYYSSSYNTGFVTINGVVSSYASNPAVGANTAKQELHRATQTVTHNADGTKSIAISVNHKHSSTFDLTSSATITLDTIPRTSVPTISVGTQVIGGAITVTTHRASTSFEHYIYATFGDENFWIGSSVGDSVVWTLPVGLAGKMPTKMSDYGYIWVETWSGSTYIGRNSVQFTATIPDTASYKPLVSNILSSIFGTGRDKTIAKYVQSISKAILSFTTSAQGGATLISSSINIKRQTDNANNMTISGYSGTSGILTVSGTYLITATSTDSRGKSTVLTTTIVVEAYVVPIITKFTGLRQVSAKTSIDLLKTGTYTHMGGSNTLSVVIAKAPRGGIFANIDTVAGVTGVFSGTFVAVGNSETASFDFKLTITDSFGNSSIATITVSTSSVALSIKADIGIGVGKVWERGTLDVQGSIYLNGLELLALIYPVGAIYLSVVATSPATLFGGTWVAMQNQFLIGAGTYVAGATGGEVNHTLTTFELAVHNHYIGNANTNGPLDAVTPSFPAIADDNGWTSSMRTQMSGGGGAHNNMPPYLSVYMWKRTA